MSGVEMQSLCSNAVVFRSVLLPAMEAVVAETAIVAAKSIAWFLLMMGIVHNESDPLCKDPVSSGRFPYAEPLVKKKAGPENKDGSDTEDDEEDDDGDEDAVDDDEDDRGAEEDGSADEGGEENGDPEDDPEANGDGASGDDDDDKEDDDEDDGEEDEEDEEEEDEEEEEETPQPPTKKRK